MLLVQWLLCNILFSCWRHYVFKLGWQLCFVVLTQFWNAKHELCFSYLTSHTCQLRCILWCRGTIKLGMGVRIMVRFPSAALSEQLRVCDTRPIRQGSQWSDPGHFFFFLCPLWQHRADLILYPRLNLRVVSKNSTNVMYLPTPISEIVSCVYVLVFNSKRLNALG